MKNCINIIVYLIGLILDIWVFTVISDVYTITNVLSQGAILATFGAALMSI